MTREEKFKKIDQLELEIDEAYQHFRELKAEKSAIMTELIDEFRKASDKYDEILQFKGTLEQLDNLKIIK